MKTIIEICSYIFSQRFMIRAYIQLNFLSKQLRTIFYENVMEICSYCVQNLMIREYMQLNFPI